MLPHLMILTPVLAFVSSRHKIKTQAMHALFCLFSRLYIVSADGISEQHTGIQMTSLGFSDKGFHASDKDLLSLSVPSIGFLLRKHRY